MAILLQGLGFSVTLVEAKDVPGGRMGRIEALGYSFDTGPTILQLPAILEQIFSRVGKRLSDYVELVPVTPNTRVHFWDGTYLDTFADKEKNRAEWERFAPGSGKKSGSKRFDRFYETHEQKYEDAYSRFIAADASSVLRYFNPFRLLPALRYAPWRSLHASLMSTLDDERLVYALSYPSKYLGLHPTTCSSVFSVIPFLELAFGVHHPRGGFRALADGMLRAFVDLGGTTRFGEEVKRIVTRGTDGKLVAQGVELASGERLEAEEVIVNADWAMAASKLLPVDAARASKDPEHLRYSASTMMLYLGLDTTYPNVPHHSIYLSESVRKTDRATLEDRRFDRDDAPFYVCNPAATDPSCAPPGHSAIYVLVPAPNTANAVDWSANIANFTDHVIERLELVGMPNVREHIRFERVFTAETWRDDFAVHRGAVFNLAHGFTQLGPLRPPSKDPGVSHLSWVGGGTHPGSGLLTIFESANIAAAAIAKAHGKRLAPSIAPPVPREPSSSVFRDVASFGETAARRLKKAASERERRSTTD